MNKFAEKLSEKLMPFADKVSNIKFLKALAETMMATIPITIVGSFACLFAFVEITPWTNFLAAHPDVQSTFLTIQSLTLGIISLYVVVILPYQYARKFNLKEAVSCSIINIAAFLLLTPTELFMNIPEEWFGAKGMFSAMVISFLTVRIIKFCVDKHITIKMPSSVPSFVENSFVVLIAAFVILFGAGTIGTLMSKTEFGSIHQVIYTIIQAPLSKVGSSFPALLFASIIGNLVMFCGIHGSTVLAFLDPIKTANNVENLAAATAGEALPHIFTSGMWSTVLCGGIGATLGLGIVMALFCKSKQYKALSRTCIVPQIFNIGEPLLFGIPIMLNPVLFIPYIGVQLINVVIVYGALHFGLCAYFTGVEVTFTIPYLLSGIYSCSVPWQGFVLQLVVLLVDCALWYPFANLIDKQALEKEQAEDAKLETAN